MTNKKHQSSISGFLNPHLDKHNHVNNYKIATMFVVHFILFFLIIVAMAYAQMSSTTRGIILTWDHPSPDNVSHYWIERSIRVDFRDSARIGPIESTTYVDHPTTAGRTYYRVFAEGNGGISEPSSYAQIVVEFPPSAPINLSLTKEQ